jgi:hypothetical protein
VVRVTFVKIVPVRARTVTGAIEEENAFVLSSVRKASKSWLRRSGKKWNATRGRKENRDILTGLKSLIEEEPAIYVREQASSIIGDRRIGLQKRSWTRRPETAE